MAVILFATQGITRRYSRPVESRAGRRTMSLYGGEMKTKDVIKLKTNNIIIHKRYGKSKDSRNIIVGGSV